MNIALAFVVLVLATYRLAVLIAEDEITHTIREWIAGRGYITLHEDGEWCVSCASIWAAGAVLILALYAPPIVIILALAGAARWLWLRED